MIPCLVFDYTSFWEFKLTGRSSTSYLTLQSPSPELFDKNKDLKSWMHIKQVIQGKKKK
jgi:hypothetical protein